MACKLHNTLQSFHLNSIFPNEHKQHHILSNTDTYAFYWTMITVFIDNYNNIINKAPYGRNFRSTGACRIKQGDPQILAWHPSDNVWPFLEHQLILQDQKMTRPVTLTTGSTIVLCCHHSKCTARVHGIHLKNVEQFQVPTVTTYYYYSTESW